jgi:hypothetical protein
MAIDIACEKLITFKSLVREISERSGDRPLHICTPMRWRSPGLKGIKLEAVRIGGTWYTSLEAFGRFSERLTALAEGENVTVSTRSHSRSHKAADSRLDDDGW